MHRLAIFHHDIVCNVNNVIDRAHTGIADTLLHPFRRRCNFHVFDHTGCITRAEIGVFNDNPGQISNIAPGFCRNSRFMQLQCFPECHSSFTGKPDHAEAVRPVGRDLKINNMIIKPQFHRHILAGCIITLENQNPVFYSVREIVLGHTELPERTEHTVRRDTAQRLGFDFNAARQERSIQCSRNQVALMHILCTGADLNGVSVSDVNLTNPHMV